LERERDLRVSESFEGVTRERERERESECVCVERERGEASFGREVAKSPES
jgi:hypothetical protein